MKPKVLSSAAFRRTAACLVLAAFGGAMILGCNSLFANRGDSIFASIRPASGDTDRLLKNAHYFTLMGRPDLSLKELEEAYQLEPQNLKIVNALAQNYEEVGRFEQAQKLYQEALNRQGPNPALENNLCFSYYQAGQWKEAENCFRQALARNPQNTAVRNNLGLLLCRTGRQEEARRLWSDAWGEAVAQSRMNQALAALDQQEQGLPQPLAQAQRASQVPPAPREQPAPQAQPAPPKESSTPAKGASVAMTTSSSAPAPSIKLKEKLPEAAPVAKQEPRPQAASPAPPATAPSATGEKSPVTAPKPPEKPVIAARPAPKQTEVQPTIGKPYLTLQELLGNAIEVRNGNGIRDIAFNTRSMLAREGFQVAEIGNHLDFGMEQTTIYYRPIAEKVAQVVKARFFQTARLEPSQKLSQDVNLKIVLGGDLLQQPQDLVKLGQAAPTAEGQALPKQPKAEASAISKSTVGPQTVAPASPAAAMSESPPAAVSPPARQPENALETNSKFSLTVDELSGNPIEVRNGNGLKDIAFDIRTMLAREGFRVVCIGNHLDFGMEQTTIYYRPKAEKVARILNAKTFKSARLEPSENLPEGVNLKIILGRDLLARKQVLAHLPNGEQK